MKKTGQFTALLLALSLCSCDTAPEQTEIGTDTVPATSAVTTASAVPEVTAATSPEETPKEPQNMSELPAQELGKAVIINNNQYLDLFPVPGRLDQRGLFYKVKDGDSITLSGWNVCREPALMLSEGAYDTAVKTQFVESIESPYTIDYDPPELVFGKPQYSSGAAQLFLNEIKLGCRIDDDIKTRAFVRKGVGGNKGNYVEFIIDPAYMRGIPVYTKNDSRMRFDINGEKVCMDSFMVGADVHDDIMAMLPESGYVYADVQFCGLDISYSTEKGYKCSAMIESLEILTDDTGTAIDGKLLEFGGEEKDPEMVKTYSAIVNDMDKIYTDETYGIILLDMDFDGTPEVLSSRYKPYEYGEDWQRDTYAACETDVYRVDGDGLKYIDTMQITNIEVYDVSAFLGLKTLENGTKGWFTTIIEYDEDGKYKERADCLFTLEGDTLKKTEVFRPGILTDYYDDNYADGYFWYFGEKIYPEIEYYELTEEQKKEPYAYERAGSWNGVWSSFGVWEIYGKARAQFCEGITESYLLYSDWITNITLTSYVAAISEDKKELSTRDVIYNIAYLVDAFYLGEYNPAERAAVYRFLGDYAKPVIYLYPEEETRVSVSVDFADGGAITCSYPEYSGGWNVTAMPDGTLYDENGDEYYCLYWEGAGNTVYDNSKGWCVEGKDTAKFLREKLTEIGLTAREANEFIIYWLPLMQKNPYNIITFHTDDYAASVPLGVSPAPDTMIRVFMTFEPSDEPVVISPQQLPRYERNGFTLVEWGGRG